MTAKLDISVLFSTFNRVPYLTKTLDVMSRLDRAGLEVEFVAIDNNSSDDTRQVIESFQDRMPLRYLFEPKAGKSCAMNRALNEVELGRVVVLTDDDILPPADWLQRVVASCQRHPDRSVFGGRVNLVFPEGLSIPDWARENRYIQVIAFARHDFGDEECEYPPEEVPIGPNCWVRRELFEMGVRYDESIGPLPGTKFRMGEDTDLMQQFLANGYPPLYVPDAAVGHPVQPSLLTAAGIRQRFIRFGYGVPHRKGLDRLDLLQKHPRLWRLLRRFSIGRDYLRTYAPLVSLASPERRIARVVDASRDLGANIEALNMSLEAVS